MKFNLDQFTPEFQLMLAILSADELAVKMARINQLIAKPIDWESFLRLLNRHRVYPQINEVLNRLPCEVLPEAVLAKLQTRCRENAMVAMKNTGELVRIVRSMEEKGIKVIALKGQTLAQRLYGNIGLRTAGDIDLLVAPEELAKAEEILMSCGYREEYAEQRMTTLRRNIHYKNMHHSNFLQDERKVHVELHWRLGSSWMELPFPEASELQKVSLAGYTLHVLDNELEILFLAIHGAMHGWLQLRWLYDIVMFMKSNSEKIDWEHAVSLAERLGVTSLFLQMLILVNYFFSVPLPAILLTAIKIDERAKKMANLSLVCVLAHERKFVQPSRWHEASSWLKIKFYNFFLRTGRNKVKYLSMHFRPSNNDFQLVSLSDRWYFLYYLLRPFTWLRRSFSKK